MTPIEHRLLVLEHAVFGKRTSIWTRTSEQLPPNSHIVLAYDGSDAFLAYVYGGRWFSNKSGQVIEAPTYWLHEPQIPPAAT